MEQIKSNLKAVIGSSKSGVPLNKLEEEYKRVTNSTLNYLKYCSSLDEFLESVSDVVEIRYFGNICYLILRTTENDPQCLKKLYDLIQHTRSKKNSKKPNQIPQNLLARSSTFNNLRISVGNELCTPPRPFGCDRKPGSNNYSTGTQQAHYNGFSRSLNKSAPISSANRNQNSPRAPQTMSGQMAVANQIKNTRRPFNDNAGNGGNSNNNSINSSYNTAHVVTKPFSHNCTSSQSEDVADTTANQSVDRKNVENKESGGRDTIDNQTPAKRADFEDSQSVSTAHEENSQSESNQNHNRQLSTARHPDSASRNTTPVKESGSSQDSLLWPMNTTLDVQILHRQVKIFGVQSGYAVVSVLSAISTSHYIDVKPIGDTQFPGDIVIWQPPIADPSRPPCTIDTATAFPVILLASISSHSSSGSSSRYHRDQLVKVRVLGQRVMMLVSLTNLFTLAGSPGGSQAQVTLLTSWRERQTCLCRLAGVPYFVDMWEHPVGSDDVPSGPRLLAGTFFAPVSIEARQVDFTGNKNDEFVFERCERRGDFLNCSLLMFGSVVHMPQLPTSKQLQFVELWVEQLIQCKRALRPNFEAMLETSSPVNCSGEGAPDGPGTGLSLMANESSVLLPIWDLGRCENKMLIGCPSLFSGRSRPQGAVRGFSVAGHAEQPGLERVVYSGERREFQLFDSNLQKADVAVPPTGATGWPLIGIYILNERFVHSRLSHVSTLRFQAAMLLLPDFTRLRAQSACQRGTPCSS